LYEAVAALKNDVADVKLLHTDTVDLLVVRPVLKTVISLKIPRCVYVK